MPWTQVSGLAKDCVKKIPRAILMSEDGGKAVVTAVHCHDALSVVSTEFSNHATHVSARRSANETCKASHARFDLMETISRL